MNLEAAKLKYLELGEDIRDAKRESTNEISRADYYQDAQLNLLHTYSKLGMFLSSELGALWDNASDINDPPEGDGRNCDEYGCETDL